MMNKKTLASAIGIVLCSVAFYVGATVRIFGAFINRFAACIQIPQDSFPCYGVYDIALMLCAVLVGLVFLILLLPRVNRRYFGAGLAAAALIVCTGAGFVVWRALTPDIPQKSRTALTRLQVDMRGISPHFIDASKANAQVLTMQEQKIRAYIAAFFVGIEPGSSDFYSQLWLDAVGTRYILATQPIAESSYDEIIDAQTGKVTRIPGETRFYLPPGRNIALYIDRQAIYTYTLDDPSYVLVQGSQLSGDETYHSGESDAYLAPEETHTDDSITISIFDSSEAVQNPKAIAQPTALQTMSKKLREVTLAF